MFGCIYVFYFPFDGNKFIRDDIFAAKNNPLIC